MDAGYCARLYREYPDSYVGERELFLTVVWLSRLNSVEQHYRIIYPAR